VVSCSKASKSSLSNAASSEVLVSFCLLRSHH
jgi:hypothetical protein